MRVKLDNRNGSVPAAGTIKLARMLAEIVTSNDKQNVIILIEAKPGYGKSYAALDLAVWTAIEISKIKGGDPWYYFNMEHVAIINSSEIVRVIEIMHQLGVYIFDDFGVGYSSRDWQSDGNRAMNDMLMTIRTDNNILIMTVPDAEWIDKIGRNILHFKVVMTQKLFQLGRTMGKLTIEDKMYNAQSKKILHKYLHTEREVYNNVMFCFPPKNVAIQYDYLRKIQLDILKATSKEVYAESQNCDGRKVSPKVESLQSQVEFFCELKHEGTKVHEIKKELNDRYGDLAYTTKYLGDYAKEHGLI